MASTIKVNSIIAQAGTDVNVLTGYKLKVADAGELYVGGSQITTGATQVTSRNANTTIGVGSGDVDLTGKSMSVVSIDASSGTGAIITVTLPLASTFPTTAIQVVSSTAHGAGNKIVINKHATDGGAEVYTLYHIGDHCELVSDGTNVIRTGNEFVTIRGDVFLTTGVAAAGSAVSDTWDVAGSSNYTVTQVGGGWSTTTDDFNAPHAGLYYFGGYYAGTTGQYNMGWTYHDGTAFITDNSSRHAPNGVNTDGIMRSMAAADKNIWYGSNHSSATTALGAASGGDRCSVYFYMIRRY